MDEKYFDAKFEGLEKLMVSQHNNLNGYINAVNANVIRLESDLSAHKDNDSAHGVSASDKTTAKLVSWGGLGLAMILGALEALKSSHK